MRVGTHVRGKWRLDALLGVGGMAAVYAATHKMGRRDALKILHRHVAVSKELRARFEQEANAVSRLGHPDVVQVLDTDVAEDGSPFLVMELLDGESLGQRIDRTDSVPVHELLGIAGALLDVLRVAHERGIIHRDIKPDNLFITRDGRLKVLDFGIARMREGLNGVHTRAGAVLGTTAFMAPEQIMGGAIDGRADLFALGATMFRILARRKIHEADSEAELLIKMGTVPAPPLHTVAPHVDPAVARIVDRALAFDRAARYPDAASMLADVRALTAHAASTTNASGYGVPGAHSSSASGRVPPWLIVAVVVVTLALGAATAIGLFMVQDKKSATSAGVEDDRPSSRANSSKAGSTSSAARQEPSASSSAKSAKPKTKPTPAELLEQRLRDRMKND